MASQIKLKRSSVPGNSPTFGTEIVEGELALNTADQKLYSANSTATFTLADLTSSISASNGADNRIAVFTNATNVEGDANFTYDGTTLDHAGSASGAYINVGSNLTTGTAKLELGLGRSDNGYAYIDLIGDTSYTDYGFRLIRNNSGANADSELAHRGTGTLRFRAYEAGAIQFDTNNTARMRIQSDGKVGIACTSPTVALDVIGTTQIRQDAVDSTFLEFTTDQNGSDRQFLFKSPLSDTDINDYFSFETSNALKFEIDADPVLRLESNGDLSLGNTPGGAPIMHVDKTDARVGIGTTAPAGKLDIRGTNERVVNIIATESVSDSDQRYEFNLDYNYTMDGTTVTANRNKVPFYIDADVNGTVGVGGSGVPADGTRESLYAAFVRTTSTHTAGTMYHLRGLDTIVQHDASANVYYTMGTQNYALHSGTGSLLNAAYACQNLSIKTSTTDGGNYIGTATYVRNSSGAGTMGTVAAYQGYIDQDSTSTISTGYIYRGWVQGDGTGQGINTAYGLWLDMNNGYTGTIGTAYGVYVTDEDKNYFSGSVGIGTTSPTQALDVAGTITTSANVHITGSIRDSSGNYGTSGQVLSSTGAGGINWTNSGGGSSVPINDIFYENSANVTTSYTISTNKNALSAGPITINSGVTVTIPSNSVWTIV